MAEKKSVFDLAADALSPPYNVYVGRDTSDFALGDFALSMTKQDFAEECDINVLMSRYLKSGSIPQYVDRQPFYVDALDMPTFMEAQNILISARESFMSLPADVRREFDNDPALFVEFANDEKNVAKLKEWNMLSPEAVKRLDEAAALAASEAAKAAERAQAAARAAGAPSAGGLPPVSPTQ